MATEEDISKGSESYTLKKADRRRDTVHNSSSRKVRYVKSLPLLTVLCLLAPMPYAQERTAGGPLDTQMSWTALKNLTDQASNNAKAAHIRLNQLEICAKKKMLYSPSTVGADGDGCISSGANYTGPLIAGGKTGEDCMDAGGRPTNIGNGYICQMNGGLKFIDTAQGCPAGWTRYQNWSRTVANSCSSMTSCNTGSHKFQNTAQEWCSYYTPSRGNSDRQAGGIAQATSCEAHFFSVGCT